jgi:hypothetical protein
MELYQKKKLYVYSAKSLLACRIAIASISVIVISSLKTSSSTLHATSNWRILEWRPYNLPIDG